MDSGSLLPTVSGKNIAKLPAIKAIMPINNIGAGCQNEDRSPIKIAITPPTRATVEQTPENTNEDFTRQKSRYLVCFD